MKCLKLPVRTLCLFGLAVFVLISGCSTISKPFECEAPTMTLNIIPARDINPADDGRASPVVLNVFALEGDRQFEQEDFISLFQDPDAVLGKDLLSLVKLREITPGEDPRQEKIDLDVRTRYVGVMAEYIRYEDAETKIVIPREDECESNVTLFIDRLSMRFEK